MNVRVLLVLGIFGGAAFAAYTIFANVPELGDLFNDDDCTSDDPDITCKVVEGRCVCTGQLTEDNEFIKNATQIAKGQNISGEISGTPRPRSDDTISVGVR